jgi:hypothetical protein
MYRHEPRMIEVLRHHVGHYVMVNGWGREITERSIQPDNATMAYGGFAVDCMTCMANLSQQWHGPDVPRETTKET